MDVEKVFHMTGGVGETSYARNSELQKKGSDMVKDISIEAIQEVCVLTSPRSIGIADLGCSSGQNTLSTIKQLVDAVQQTSCPKNKIKQYPHEFRIYLNDLPTNDFNAIFKSLPDFYKELKKDNNYGEDPTKSSAIYLAAYPGTFYGRLFPDKCLHFVYSSYSLHWLSRIPPAIYDREGRSINKGSIYISEASPSDVSQAYSRQFQEDFSLFLRSRSQELVVGGRMVLLLLARSGANHIDRGNSFLWKLLTKSFAILVSQGKVEEEKLDEYDVHFYAPSKDEIRDEVRKEGSFVMDRLETFEMDKEVEGGTNYGTVVAMAVRAIQESMIVHHFGEGILADLFEHYARLVDEEMAIQYISPISLVIALSKL